MRDGASKLGQWLTLAAAAAALVKMGAAAAAATGVQGPVDRADPSVVEEELRDPRTDRKPQEPGRPIIKADDRQSQAPGIGPIEVSAIRVDGPTALPQTAFAAATRPFLGRTLSGSDLRALAGAVADVARRAGYGLATAWIPQQVIQRGVLRVQLDQGRIDGIEASGNAASLVERILAPLADGTAVRTAELERRLLLAEDLYGVSIGKARLSRVDGRNILLIDTRREPAVGRISIDNWGSGTVGPVRAHFSTDFHGVLSAEDRFSFGGVITPLQPREFALIRGGYTKGIGTNGTEFSFGGYAARSQPGGVLRDRDFEGKSVEGSVALSHPLLRRRSASAWGDLELRVRDAEQTRRGVTIRDDRLSVLRASTYFSARAAGGRARARVALSRGLGIFDATREADPLRSRSDGSAIFSKAEFWAHYDREIAGPVSVQVQAEGQVASRPLLSSEEMGLGGRYFLRGYDYREFSGDKGIAGSVELRFDLNTAGGPVRAAQVYTYADAGSVGNLEEGRGGGSLASIGGGVRVWLKPKVEASIEVGVPLREGFDEDQDLDPRISFTLTSRF